MHELRRRFHPIKEAAYELGIGVTKLYDLVKRGELELVRIDGRSLVPQESLDSFAARIRRAGE